MNSVKIVFLTITVYFFFGLNFLSAMELTVEPESTENIAISRTSNWQQDLANLLNNKNWNDDGFPKQEWIDSAVEDAAALIEEKKKKLNDILVELDGVLREYYKGQRFLPLKTIQAIRNDFLRNINVVLQKKSELQRAAEKEKKKHQKQQLTEEKRARKKLFLQKLEEGQRAHRKIEEEYAKREPFWSILEEKKQRQQELKEQRQKQERERQQQEQQIEKEPRFVEEYEPTEKEMQKQWEEQHQMYAQMFEQKKEYKLEQELKQGLKPLLDTVSKGWKKAPSEDWQDSIVRVANGLIKKNNTPEERSEIYNQINNAINGYSKTLWFPNRQAIAAAKNNIFKQIYSATVPGFKQFAHYFKEVAQSPAREDNNSDMHWIYDTKESYYNLNPITLKKIADDAAVLIKNRMVPTSVIENMMSRDLVEARRGKHPQLRSPGQLGIMKAINDEMRPF